MIIYSRENTGSIEVSESLVSAYSAGVKSKALLTALGDYWTDYYTDSETLSITATGAVALYSKEYSALLDMVLSSNIIDIPTEKPVYYQLYSFAQELFKPYTNFEGEVEYLYADFTGVKTIEYLTSSLFEPGVILTRGTHFDIINNELRFYVNPFTDPGIINYAYAESGAPNLRVYLWATNVVFSDSLIYDRFGRFVYTYGEDSKDYHNIALAMLKFYADSKSVGRIEAIINIMFGMPFSRYSGEVVTEINTVNNLLEHTIGDDIAYTEVVTTKNKYYAFYGSTLLVSEGQVLLDYELIARCHLVKDYVTDPTWHKNVAFPPELIVENDGSANLSEIMDKIVKYNIIYVKLVATFETYEQYKSSILEIIELIKSGIPVYLYPFIDRTFSAIIEDYLEIIEQHTFGITKSDGESKTSGGHMLTDDLYTRCECGEYNGSCVYYGDPILDHGKDTINFLPFNLKQNKGDNVYYEGRAYYSGKNNHQGVAPNDIIYSFKNLLQVTYNGLANYNPKDGSPTRHKAVPSTVELYDGDNYFSKPVNSPANIQLFEHYHSCETDILNSSLLHISFTEDELGTGIVDELTFIEIRSGRYSDCYITGPVELTAGSVGVFSTTRGIADNIRFSGSMELVGQDDTGFLCRLPSGQNEGTISIYYDDILCSEITVVRASTYFQKPTNVLPEGGTAVSGAAMLQGSDPVILDSQGAPVEEDHEASSWYLYKEAKGVRPSTIPTQEIQLEVSASGVTSTPVDLSGIQILDITDQILEVDRAYFEVGSGGCFITHFSRDRMQAVSEGYTVSGKENTFVVASYRQYYPDSTWQYRPCIIRFAEDGSVLGAVVVDYSQYISGSGVYWVVDDPYSECLLIHAGFGVDRTVSSVDYSINYIQVSYDLTTVKSIQLTQSDNVTDQSGFMSVTEDVYFIAHTTNIVAISKDMQVLDVISSATFNRLDYVEWHEKHQALYAIDKIDNDYLLVKVGFDFINKKFNPVAEKFLFEEGVSAGVTKFPVWQKGLDLFFFRVWCNQGDRFIAINSNKEVELEFTDPTGDFIYYGDDTGPAIFFDEDTGEYKFIFIVNELYKGSSSYPGDPDVEIYHFTLKPDGSWDYLYQYVPFVRKYVTTNSAYGVNWDYSYVQEGFFVVSGFDRYTNPVVMKLPIVNYANFTWDPEYFKMSAYDGIHSTYGTTNAASIMAGTTGDYTFLNTGLHYGSDLLTVEEIVNPHPEISVITNNTQFVEGIILPFGQSETHFVEAMYVLNSGEFLNVLGVVGLPDESMWYLCTVDTEVGNTLLVLTDNVGSILKALLFENTSEFTDIVFDGQNSLYLCGSVNGKQGTLVLDLSGNLITGSTYPDEVNTLCSLCTSEGSLVALADTMSGMFILSLSAAAEVTQAVSVSRAGYLVSPQKMAIVGDYAYILFSDASGYGAAKIDVATSSQSWAWDLGADNLIDVQDLKANTECVAVLATEYHMEKQRSKIYILDAANGADAQSINSIYAELTSDSVLTSICLGSSDNSMSAVGKKIGEDALTDAIIFSVNDVSTLNNSFILNFRSELSEEYSAAQLLDGKLLTGGMCEFAGGNRGAMFGSATLDYLDPMFEDAIIYKELSGDTGFQLEQESPVALTPYFISGKVYSAQANTYTLPSEILEYDKLYYWSTKYFASWAQWSPLSDKTPFISDGSGAINITVEVSTDPVTPVFGNLFSVEGQGIDEVIEVAYHVGLVGKKVTGTNGGEFTVFSNGDWGFDPGTDFTSLVEAPGESVTTSIKSHGVVDGVRTGINLAITVTSAAIDSSILYFGDAQIYEPVSMSTVNYNDPAE